MPADLGRLHVTKGDGAGQNSAAGAGDAVGEADAGVHAADAQPNNENYNPVDGANASEEDVEKFADDPGTWRDWEWDNNNSKWWWDSNDKTHYNEKGWVDFDDPALRQRHRTQAGFGRYRTHSTRPPSDDGDGEDDGDGMESRNGDGNDLEAKRGGNNDKKSCETERQVHDGHTWMKWGNEWWRWDKKAHGWTPEEDEE